MNDLPPPVALALVVADEVTIDSATNKPTARGIFYDVHACPVRLDFSILAIVTEVRRHVALTVAVLDPEDNPVHRAEWSIDSADPLRIHGNVTHCRGVEFARPGVYRVNVSCNGATVAEQPIAVSIASAGRTDHATGWVRRRERRDDARG